MDVASFFDLGPFVTGLVMAFVLVCLAWIAPGMRAMALWFALALLCDTGSGVVGMGGFTGAPATEFLLSALHGLGAALILMGLRTLGPGGVPSSLVLVIVSGMLVWLGGAVSASLTLASVLIPVHLGRGVLFLVCAVIAIRNMGRLGVLASTLSLLLTILSFAALLVLWSTPQWFDLFVLRGLEEALTLGLMVAAIWAVCATKPEPATMAESGGDLGGADQGRAGLLDLVQQGLALIGPDGRIVWANRYAGQLLAGADEGALTGVLWTDVFPTLRKERGALARLPDCMNGRKDGDVPGLAVMARALDGRIVPVQLARSGDLPSRIVAPEGAVLLLIQPQVVVSPNTVGRLSLSIDRHLLNGETVDVLCEEVCVRIADMEAAPLVWIALGEWRETLVMRAVGGVNAPCLEDLVGAPVPQDVFQMVEPALRQGRSRLIAGGIPRRMAEPGDDVASGGVSGSGADLLEGEFSLGPASASSMADWQSSSGLFPIIAGERTLGIMVVHGGAGNLPSGILSRCDVVAHRVATAIKISQETAFLRLQAAAMSVAANAIFITDHEGRIAWVNEAFVRMSGFPAAELKGKTPHILFSGQQDDSVYADLWNTLRRGNVWRGELVERRRDGSLYTVQQTVTPMRGPDDGALHYVAVHEDISDRKRAEERIRYLSNYDTLTRLPNRTLFRDRLNQAVQQARWTGGTVAVLFLDLTQFSRVNDTLGHDVGDQILMTVGSRVNAAVAGEVDVVARMGGDEFALVQGGHSGADAAAGLARRLARIIEMPVEIGEHSVSLRATIGIAMYPGDGTDPDNLIKNADLAMHRASRSEKEAYSFFSTEMNNEAKIRLGLEGDLRRAIERDELVNFYQPQYDMNGSLVGMEALVRWIHPVRGLVSPGEFIPAAEESGLIGALGDVVLRNAVADIVHWRGLGLPLVPVAINISAVQFRDPGLVDRIRTVLNDHDLGPEALDLELTESILMGEEAGAVAFLNQLADEGFRIAIDDFGTGYSSLGYLKRFPVHKLKIDQSFVQHLQEDTNDAILVRAIVNLGHSLGMSVVAEGVETEEQFAYLREVGADVVQGYLFSRPVPSNELEALLRVESGLVLPEKRQAPN